jgi:hypothetical protein
VLFSASPESTATPISTTTIERGLIQNNPFGIQVDGESMVATLRDLIVRGNADTGLYLAKGATVDVERALISRNTGLGVLVTGPFLDEEDLGVARPGDYLPPSVRLTDVAVEETLGLEGDTGERGRGLHAQYGSVTGERIRFARNREVGISAFAATLDLSDVAVDETLPAACGDDCPVHPFGHAVIKGPTARVRFQRFRVSGAPLCGFLTITPRQLALSEGLVAENEIGVCAQGDVDFDLLEDDVLFRDNNQNLDSTMLPVPALQLTE